MPTKSIEYPGHNILLNKILVNKKSTRGTGMKKKFLLEFNKLGIEGIDKITELHELKGDFINLKCRLPNGQTAKILDDNKMYYGAEICKKNSQRCYGLASDSTQIAVFEYGNGGSDAELVIWKRLDP